MILDLTHLFEDEGGEVPFSHLLDLSQVEFFGRHILQKPVEVEGRAVNTAGVVSLQYEARYRIDTVCDRCLEPVSREMAFRREQVVVKGLSGEENDEYLVVPDGLVNLDELVYADVVLELPSKNVCSEDCRGLCECCGANLNHGACGCKKPSVDPRLSALQDLLGQ